MAIPAINILGNPNVTEGNFQVAIEDLRKSVIGSGKAYDSANTYSQYDTCVHSGVVYYSKINSNTGNTPTVGTNWGLIGNLITGIVHNVGNESIDGVKTFTSSPVVPTPTTSGNVITMDNIIQKTAVAIGYGTGAGGSVTQLTSKSTNVTLNKPCGQITMSNSTLNAGDSAYFNVFNNLISLTDNIILSPVESVSNSLNYKIEKFVIVNGSFGIKITNISGLNLSEAFKFNFIIIKGATS